MCTTAAKRLDNTWYLIKTRDPVPWMRWDDEIKLFNTKDEQYKKLIIQNPDPNQDGYYGGINEKGVAYIATFVGVSENQISYIRRPYVRLILDAKTAKEGVEIIKSFNPRIGGNMFIADEKECYGIEAVPEKYFVEKVEKELVKTNHFIHLPNRNLSFDTNPKFESWTKDRYERANKLISETNNLEDLKKVLRDRENKNNPICRTDKETECYTYSAFIFDTKRKKVHYCQGNPMKNDFKEYTF